MAWGDTVDQRGAVKPSSLEQETFDPKVGAFKYVEVPSNLQARYAYNADGTVLYAGYAVRGLASSDDGWLLQKFTYDGSMRVTLRQIAYDTWDNASGATYA